MGQNSAGPNVVPHDVDGVLQHVASIIVRETVAHSPSAALGQLLWLSMLTGPDLLLQFFGIVGNPVGHSLSPALHNSAFAAAGLDCCYIPLLVDDAKQFLEGPGHQFAGFSVTIPHKVGGRADLEVPDVIQPTLVPCDLHEPEQCHMHLMTSCTTSHWRNLKAVGMCLAASLSSSAVSVIRQGGALPEASCSTSCSAFLTCIGCIGSILS